MFRFCFRLASRWYARGWDMFKQLLGCMVLAMWAPAFACAAEEWAPIVVTNNGSVVAIEVSGVVAEGDLAKGWQRRVVKSPERSPNGKRFWIRDSYETYDCAHRRVRTEQAMYKT